MQRANTIPESPELLTEATTREGRTDTQAPFSFDIPAAWDIGISGPWTWNGTRAEFMAFRKAAHRAYGRQHRASEPCFCWRLFDQREIDGALFARHIAQRFITQEMTD